MNLYDTLKQYQYNNLDEAEEFLSEEKPHFFITVTNEELQQAQQLFLQKTGFSFPPELVHFWKTIGAGELFSFVPDQYEGRYEILDPASVLGIYFEEDDYDQIYNTLRRDANEYLHEKHLLAFCAFQEYSALYLALTPNQNGNCAVYDWNSNKIANSLAEYITNILKQPDYFLA